MLKNYKELNVWQKSYELCLRIYRITAKFPKEERYGLTSQIRRSVVSIPSNIAEGYGRKTTVDYLTLVGEQHIQMCSARCDRPSTVISIECSRLREVIVENQNIRVKILEKLALILRDRIESSYAAVESL